MGLISLDCRKCGAGLQIDEAASTYTCKYCLTAHVRDDSSGRKQTEEELKQIDSRREAERYYLQAMFILHEVQARIKVYGSNSAPKGTSRPDVDLALQYVDRSLELFPDSAVYLNLKALLFSEGKGRREEAVVLLEKAVALNPREITIQNNLKNIQNIVKSAQNNPKAR